jgi:hypothetical protein
VQNVRLIRCRSAFCAPRIQPEPGSYLIFRISRWDAANLEPSVNTISAPTTVLNIADLSRFDRLFARLDYASSITQGRSLE